MELFGEALACLELHPTWGGPGAPRNFGLRTVLVGIYTPGFKYILDCLPLHISFFICETGLLDTMILSRRTLQ